MIKHKCNICNEEFADKYFDTKQNKCILHCEKDDWFEEFNEKTIIMKALYNRNKNWLSSDTKIDLFWEKFNHIIDESLKKSLKISLNDIIFPAMGYGIYPKVEIYKIKFLSLKKCNFLDNIDLTLFFDAKNLEIKNCIFYDDAMIKDIIHKEQFIFQNNKVLKNIEFFNIEFKHTCVFVENKFKKELNFKNVRFNDYAVFNDSEIEDLFFNNTFFRKETNFLNIKLSKIRNRETARIIKDSFEQQNNIIEANKFYALEMKEREKELEEDKKNGKNLFEWLVFKIHGLASNHSQDWILSLFWILSFTFTFLTMEFVNTHYLNNVLEYILIDIIIFLGFVYGSYLIIEYEKINKFWYIGIYYIFYGFFSQDWLLKCFSNKLNPFSIMTGNEKLTFGGLIFKIIIAYLIYQLIISIRQNTRRK